MRVEITLSHQEIMEALENYLKQSTNSPYLSDGVGFPGINFVEVSKIGGNKPVTFSIGEGVSMRIHIQESS